MANPALSSDIEQEASPPRAPSPKPFLRKRKAKTRGTEKIASKSSHQEVVMDKDAMRRHNALERQFNKAKAATQEGSIPALIVVDDAAQPSVPPVASPQVPNIVAWPQGDVILIPQGQNLTCMQGAPLVQAPVPPQALNVAPDTNLTPAVTVLSNAGSCSSGQALDFQSILSQAFASIFQAGLQQQALLNSSGCNTSAPQVSSLTRPSTSSQSYQRLEESVQEEDYLEDFELSDDDENIPDKPAFPGLFRPALFKSLLHKAKVATNMGKVLDPASLSQDTSNPNEALFKLPQPEFDFVPCPDLFSQVIQQPWERPRSISGPTGHDKRMYWAAPELDTLLQLPSVDEPVSSLISSSVLASDVGDGLKVEDKRAEIFFQKTHQAAAWAIRAATSASFFNRASLIWLRQLRDRLPPEEARMHQDVTKLIAAVEYSADASLDAAKFASRALASTVVSRSLLLLRHWRADSKSK